jgi:hypothetical protein
MRENEGGTVATGGSRTALWAGLIILGAVVAGGIIYLAIQASGPRPVPIGDILADLRKYDGQTVTIAGEASNPLNVLVMKAYDVSDGTGSIKVVTERGLPAAGSVVRVEGVVHEVFNLGGMNYTVLLEPAGV